MKCVNDLVRDVGGRISTLAGDMKIDDVVKNEEDCRKSVGKSGGALVGGM